VAEGPAAAANARAPVQPGRSSPDSGADAAALPPATERPPVELQAPDITRWRVGNTGVDHVHAWDSGVPGPRVLLTALVHGNEICGAIVARPPAALGPAAPPRAAHAVVCQYRGFLSLRPSPAIRHALRG